MTPMVPGNPIGPTSFGDSKRFDATLTLFVMFEPPCL